MLICTIIFKKNIGYTLTMNEIHKKHFNVLELINIPVGLLLMFCFYSSLLVLMFAMSNAYYFFIAFPLIGVFFTGIYFFVVDRSIENVSKLFLIDVMIFLLYAICIFVVMVVSIDPITTTNRMLYSIVLSMLYNYYFVLLIPLAGVVVVTISYIKLNRPLSRRKLSIIIMNLVLVIVLFLGVYVVLNWAVPSLQAFYDTLPDDIWID
jgi:hypothetical protein